MQLSKTNLFAEIGRLSSHTESFLDLLGNIFFRELVEDYFLGVEIVDRLSGANDFREFFKRCAKLKFDADSYATIAAQLNSAAEIYRHRNKCVHGVVVSFDNIKNSGYSKEQFLERGSSEEAADRMIEFRQHLTEKLQSETQCPFFIVSPARRKWIFEDDITNGSFYFYTIWDVTQQILRLEALYQIMSIQWLDKASSHDREYWERLFKKTSDAGFGDHIKAHAEVFYGPQ